MKRLTPAKIIFYIVFLSLLASLIFVVVKLLQAPVQANSLSEKEKSDYILMVLQCALGLLVLFLPSALEKRLSVFVPDAVSIMYFMFLYAAIYLGEVHSFYYRIPHWDVILHTFSGLMVGALGFSLVSLFNRDSHFTLTLSPGYQALTAFLFACTVGLLWEVYEFLADSLLQTNMQKYLTESGVALVGQAALLDTMKDLIVDAAAGAAISVIGYFSLKNGGGWIEKFALIKLPRGKNKKG